MKKAWLKFCALTAAIMLMVTALAGCGVGNPFLGHWDDDSNRQSFIFNKDGTGALTTYNVVVEFTYTWEGDRATITCEERGFVDDAVLADGGLYFNGSFSQKVDEAEYVPENQ